MDYSKLCIRLAQEAYKLGEVPIGCVIVKDGKVIAQTHNLVQTLKDPTAHAEILAIRQATINIDDKYLEGCEVYVSVEPCVMCSYALVLARVKKVVFHALDSKQGGVMSLYTIFDDPYINHRIKWVYEPRDEAKRLIEEFFRELRKVHKGLF